MTLILLFTSSLNRLPYRGAGKTRDQKEIVTNQELSICSMLEIETLIELLMEKEIIA